MFINKVIMPVLHYCVKKFLTFLSNVLTDIRDESHLWLGGLNTKQTYTDCNDLFNENRLDAIQNDVFIDM